jgi:O-antigen ligase
MLFVTMFASQFVSFKRDKFVTEAEMAESAQLRPLLAEIAVQMCLDRPVFGHGFGQYTKAKRLYHQANSTSPLKKVLPYMQHNVFLSYLTETGIVGGLLLLGLLAGFLAEIRRLWRHSAAGSVRQATALVGLAVVVCYAVNGMFHDVSIIPMLGSLFYFFMGLTSRLARTPPRIAAAAFPAQAESSTPACRLAS